MQKSFFGLFMVLASSFVVVGCSQNAQPLGQVEESFSHPNYQVYNKSNVETALSTNKQVALFFHSKSCGSCAKLNTDIQANAGNIPADTIIYKTDWDTHQDLAAQYKVASYHTVAFMQKDGTSKNISGLFTLTDILSAMSQPVKAATQEPVKKIQEKVEVKENAKPAVVIPGTYEIYSETAFATALANNKKVVLNFYATRCPNCRALKKDLQATTLPANSVIFEVDYDTYSDLKTKYGVTGQTTVVQVNSDGTQANKARVPSADTVISWLQ